MTDIEKNFPIPNSDKIIRGVLRDVPDSPLIVMVHCFTGNKNCLDQYVGARAFEKAGIGSYRFDLYGYQDDQRDFLDCTLQTHADDLDVVIACLRQEYPGRKIAVTGHSLGGATVLCSKNKDFDAVILWDPTHVDLFEESYKNSYEWIPSLEVFRSRGGIEELVSKPFLESMYSFDSDRLIKEIKSPTKIIISGLTGAKRIEVKKRYYDLVNEPKDMVIIENADHSFLLNDSMDQLHIETIAWLQKLEWVK